MRELGAMTSVTLRRAASTPSLATSACRSMLSASPSPSRRPTRQKLHRSASAAPPAGQPKRAFVRRDRHHRQSRHFRQAAPAPAPSDRNASRARMPLTPVSFCRLLCSRWLSREHADVQDRAPADGQRRQALLPPAAGQALPYRRWRRRNWPGRDCRSASSPRRTARSSRAARRALDRRGDRRLPLSAPARCGSDRRRDWR